MKIVIASGKGGTGKTFVSTNLARCAALEKRVRLYDVDVEEPNSGIFFNGENEVNDAVLVMIPEIDEGLCMHCGLCSRVCQYHAIIDLPNQVLVFPELCHSCFACLELCPTHAIREGYKEIGTVSVSRSNGITIITGTLKIGETATPALISKTKRYEVGSAEFNIYDAPPGTSCPVIEALKGTDYVLIVAEPTLFGLHDMDLIIRTVRQMDLPFGVVVNKAVTGNRIIEAYCQKHNVVILATFPHSEEAARIYAAGEFASEKLPEFNNLFLQLVHRIESELAWDVA